MTQQRSLKHRNCLVNRYFNLALTILVALSFVGCEKRGLTEGEKENKAIFRRVIEEVWNQRKLEVIEEILATDFVGHMVGSPDIHGPDGLKQFVSMLLTAFNDIHFTVEDQIAEGDKVVTRWSFTGTHNGEFMGIPPTGVQVKVTGTNISRIAGGKIVEYWCNPDNLGMMQQLGVIPAMGQSED